MDATNPSKGREKNQKHFPASTRHGRSPRHGRVSGERRHFHAQTVPPKRRILCLLIQRRRARSDARSEISAGPGAVFDTGTATGTETDDLDPHHGRTRLGHRFFLEYADLLVLYPRILRGSHVPRRDPQTVTSNEIVLDSSHLYLCQRRRRTAEGV